MSSPKQKVEATLVESAFLLDGKQVCIWSDGEAFLVDKDTGDSPIGIRKARNLIAKARGHRAAYDDRGYIEGDDSSFFVRRKTRHLEEG